MNSITYTSAAQVRGAVARLLSTAAEVGTEFLPGELSEVLFNTQVHVVEASALGAVEGWGDGFPAELANLHAQHEEEGESTDLLAFRVALALYTR